MTSQTIGIARRFWRTLALHIGLVALAVLLGILAANWIIEEILVKEALNTEAEYYWDKAKDNPEFQLPDTRNLIGYRYTLKSDENLPITLRDLSTGFHELKAENSYSVAFVSEFEADRLLLVFNAGQVRELALFFGLVPLGLLLFVIYGSLLAGYRLFRSSVSPVILLSNKVDKLKLETLDSSDFEIDDLPENVDHEIISLTSALNQLIQRIESFVSREREFTRNVSHELRTPLTVIKIACDLLLEDTKLNKDAASSVLRIQRAAENMVNLVETFLLISREMDHELVIEPLSVNDVILSELDLIESVIQSKKIEIRPNLELKVHVETNEKILSGVIGNLLQNAATYTDTGHISIQTIPDGLLIEDTGIGMTKEETQQIFNAHFRGRHQRSRGHGIGMTIVKKLVDRFGWTVEVKSEHNVGTRVVLLFKRQT